MEAKGKAEKFVGKAEKKLGDVKHKLDKYRHDGHGRLAVSPVIPDYTDSSI